MKSQVRKIDHSLILKVNEFREAAKFETEAARATNIMRELTWLLPVGERELLDQAWRSVYVDASTAELDRVCDRIVSRITTGK